VSFRVNADEIREGYTNSSGESIVPREIGWLRLTDPSKYVKVEDVLEVVVRDAEILAVLVEGIQ
jgi:hypothetical protein